jgi:hypothetical protein
MKAPNSGAFVVSAARLVQFVSTSCQQDERTWGGTIEHLAS